MMKISSRLEFKLLIFLVLVLHIVQGDGDCGCGPDDKTCHFPFTHSDEITYNTTCKTENATAMRRWCAYNETYEGDDQWCYCQGLEGDEQSCTPNPCQNGGTCLALEDCVGNYRCTCPDGCSGKNCETCECGCGSNDKTCHFPFIHSNGITYNTTCKTENATAMRRWCAYNEVYEGDDQWCYCQGRAGDEQSCTPNPCQNGGTCLALEDCVGNYRCTCPDGCSGKNCETCECGCGSNDKTCHFPFTFAGITYNTTCKTEYATAMRRWCAYNETYEGDDQWCYCQGRAGDEQSCTPNPCQNGGTCLALEDCVGNYRCTCPDGCSGKNCETCIKQSCDSSPCQNGGTCNPACGGSNDYKCKCIKFFTGLNCEISRFLPLPTQLGFCVYHIRNEPIWRTNVSVSRDLCQSLDSDLAIVGNFTQQEDMGSLVREAYGTEDEITLFTGGIYYENNKELVWRDGTNIPKYETDEFPRWGNNQPVERNQYGAIVLTTQAVNNPMKNFVWKSFERYWAAGVICERLVSGKPCDSSPCENRASCVDVGCSYSCQCIEPYEGRNCKLFPPRLIISSPSINIFSNNFTLKCVIEGNPIPTVIWKIKYDEMLENLFENVLISNESPFNIETSVAGLEVESKLTMYAGGLCLGRSEISCLAINDESTGTTMHSFKINNPLYEPFEKNYFVFSSTETLSADDANEACRSLDSTLVHIHDEATQRFLGRNVNKRANQSTWESTDTWIGLRLNEDNVRLWPDQQNITYSNWDEGKPTTNLPCTYMSKSNKWKTQTCSEGSGNFKAYYICQNPGREIPTVVDITSPLCDSGNKSELHVTWRPSSYMTQINHTLTLTGKDTIEVIHYDLNDEENKAETYSHSFYELKPREKYQLEINVDLAYCSKPISSTSTQVTGYVTPEPLSNATLQQTSNNTCIVTWTWPQDKEHTIQHFVVKIMKFPNITRNGSYASIARSLTNENIQLNMTSHNRSVSFSALPNRRHVIEVFGQSCAGNGIAAKAIGQCIAPISSPFSIPSISLDESSSSGYIVSMRFADELNGPISCYFLVAQFADSSLSNNKPEIFSQSLLSSLESTNASEANNGRPYLAFAVTHLEKQGILFSLGDDRITSCGITGESTTTSTVRQKRSELTGRTYEARNYPVVLNKNYAMYVISSTPTLDGKILFASSDATYFVSQHTASETGNNAWIAGPVFAVLAIILLAIFLKRRTVLHKSSAELRYHVSDHQSEKSQKPLEIPIENITMLNKLGEGHFSEVWRARISYKTFNCVEAAAKIIKGTELTVHQHQEFEMELELMHMLGQNPFVIQLYGISQDKDRSIALTELVANGDLHQFLVKNRPSASKEYEPINPLGTRTMTEFSRDIASGMEFISSMNLVHRDLACRNVLLTEELRCKISDFGISRQVTETEGVYVKLNLKSAKLPSRWMSPEAYFDQTYTSASDVWSFGVVMWEIVAFGYTPYKKLNGKELQNEVLKENYRLPQPKHCPPQLYKIMQRCWNISPSYRPTFAELRKELETLVDVIENYQPVYETVMKEANLYEDVTIDAVGFAIG